MTEEQVKEIIGEGNWRGFIQWMNGQTVALTINGEYLYYSCDVRAFVEKLNTGYDRETNPHAMD